MNLHVAAERGGKAEALVLMLVPEQILLAQVRACPIMGGNTRTTISGAYMLTRKSTMLTRADASQLLTSAGYRSEPPAPAVKSPEELWTGKQQARRLFLSRRAFNYTLKSNICQKCDVCKQEGCENDAFVVIKDGTLVSGVIDKKSIARSSPSPSFTSL
jgi:DNA-directed RNA polymerase subunit A'